MQGLVLRQDLVPGILVCFPQFILVSLEKLASSIGHGRRIRDRWRVSCFRSHGINKSQRIVPGVCEQVQAVHRSGRVGACPPRSPGTEITCAVIGHAGLFISLSPCEPVSLAGKAAKAGFAIRRILFAVDKRCARCDNDSAAAQVIAEVVLNGDIRRPIVGKRGPHPHERNPTLTIHHMNRIVLGRGHCRFHQAMMFEHAIDIDRRFVLAVLLSNHLLDALSALIVKILGMDRRLSIGRLDAERLHPVCMVPFEVTLRVLLDQVAGRVILISIICCPDCRRSQVIVYRIAACAPYGFEFAFISRGVAARINVGMTQLNHIPGRIVRECLDIPTRQCLIRVALLICPRLIRRD